MNNDTQNNFTETNSEPAGKKKKEKKPLDKNIIVFMKGVFTGIFALALGISSSFFTLYQTTPKNTVTNHSIINNTTKDKLSTLIKLINNNYYEDVKEDDLREGLYEGIISGLGDPYSDYVSMSEISDYMISSTGTYAGIGVSLSQDEKTKEIIVSKVYEDGPAEKAGMQSGDIIISVDGEKIPEDLNASVDMIRGKEGSSVKLTYRRNEVERTVVITRENVNISSVDYQMLNETIGLIEITDFNEGTYKSFKKALTKLKAKGMKKVIFDLRKNSGGLVKSVTEILDEILPEGTIVYTVDKKGKKTTYTSDEKRKLEMPIAVLVSESTASAAEIFSGAIMDYNYGTLIGTKTFGKGIVQGTFPLSDGSAVKLTIATYYTPSGKSIHKKGITPDIELEYEYSGDIESLKVGEYDYAKDNQVQKAIEILTND